MIGVLFAGITTFLWVVHGHYPVRLWLVWRYANAWFVAAVFCAACLVPGLTLLRALRIGLPRAERLFLGFALGLLFFFLAMFAGGIFGLFGKPCSILLPVMLIGLGIRPRRWLRLGRVALRAVRTPARWATPGALALAALALLALVLVYVPLLSPANIHADAIWYHLTLAEHYAAAGGIVRFPEGSFVAAYPQLATTVYTWAFLLPGTTFFDRIVIAAHLEMVVFLWTLLGVGVLAARLIPRRRIGLTWAALLLFPGIFLYDSSLSVAADHILALWAPAIVLTLLRAYESLQLERSLLFAAMLAGALLTKYQAGCLVVFPVLAFAARAAVLGWRGPDRRRLFGTAALTSLAVLALWAPHWAKNAIWHHDPFYPLLREYLPSTPWVEGASLHYESVFRSNLWRPTGTLLERAKQTGLALFTFSFVPHDWARFHGSVPVFGSLFTLTSLCLPFIGAHRRLWAAALHCYSAVFIWFWVSHQDRYLQAILPLMAAVTAAALVKIWQVGILARVFAVPLVALQIAWGSDVPFIPAHAFSGQTPYRNVLALAATGYERNYFERLRARPTWWTLKKRLPEDARVLVHGDLGPLGLETMVVTDMTGWVGGIHYGFVRSPAEMGALLETLGATHVLWKRDWTRDWDSYAEDLVFHSFVTRHLVNTTTLDHHSLGEVPFDALPSEPYGLVLYWGNGASYDRGLYRLDALTVSEFGEHPKSDYPAPLDPAGESADALLERAEFAIVDPRAPGAPRPEGFIIVMRRAGHELWARTTHVQNSRKSQLVAP